MSTPPKGKAVTARRREGPQAPPSIKSGPAPQAEAQKSAPKKATKKKAATKSPPVKKGAPKKSAPKKATPKKRVSKKGAAQRTPTKKAPAKQQPMTFTDGQGRPVATPSSTTAEHITVATDGSCRSNPGPAAWAWYVSEDNNDSGFLGVSTNNVAELTAVKQAATSLPKDAHLTLLVDSQYAIQSLTRGPRGWVDGWESRGWKTAAGKPVANAGLIRSTLQALGSRTGGHTFMWVKGHAGHPLNSAADRLAQRRTRGR